ncbi:vWA domain-containing protein [Defluviimonas salinarum]|uniref:VWA domain-containing protein n=1 Tax=Defluviimonas salinarum TaxID=2992147 RepID=A0ABT3J2V2_9RHOB|nr:VWA domain-containing protein [Defluviimonas salinarum]MCW3782012.1 VWA domain-containing protein [Defluviimonas salinarum]
MTGFDLALEAFHFLRPLWLLALLPIAALWWSVRRGATRRPPVRTGIAPHLGAALTVGGDSRLRILPIDGAALAMALLCLGAAGPTWSRQPDPFVAQSAALVVALKVTPSMEAADIAPSRLERAKQKIRDLLDLRSGARTALVAYAGSAHGVVPMTEDPGVMLPYLEGLAPEVMPEEGNRAASAVTLAQGLLAGEEGPGAVLFVADALDPADAASLEAAGSAIMLAMLPAGQGDAGFDRLSAVPVLPVTPDQADVVRIDRMLDAAQARAALENSELPWRDRGAWLAWPAALLTLLWFRRGWTMRWVVLAALALCLPAHRAQADGIADWFFTPDQQGRLAFERNDFSAAAEAFIDPLWRGYALYRSGQYEAAVEVLARVETADAAFIKGMAHMKSRGYRDGVRAFETALARDPDHAAAAENLAVAKEIVDYVERVREQSDTGEEQGIGADEVVFDNESGRGAETEIEATEEGPGEGMLTAEAWMNTVDTRTGDFLRSRFLLESLAAAGEAQGEAPE